MSVINNSIILNTMKVAEDNFNKNVPEGYMEVKLSTQGKLGAPASFHVRNFKVRDIVALSLTLESDLPKRLISILNEMIFEEGIDVGNFHEKEVEELMVNIYVGFFKDSLEMVFPYTNEDLEYVKNTLGEESVKDIKEGKWKPPVTISLIKDLDTFDVPENFDSNITITNKKTGFHVTFGYMKYKDRLIVKNWLDDLYKEQEIRFKSVKDIINFNNNLILKGGSVKDLLPIDPDEEIAYKDYISEKLQTLTEASRLISVIDYNGKDVSNLSLSDKYKLMADDARIDCGMISKLAKRQAKIPFGIKPDVHMINPFTNTPCTRRLSFRIPFILQAIQIHGDNEYDDGYDDACGDNVE